MGNEIYTESTFESAIVGHLLSHGWFEGNASDFSRELALDKKAILGFVMQSQPKEWRLLELYYKADAESKFFQRLFKELDLRGLLDVLRHGITDSGIKFKMVYFKPDSTLNPDTIASYAHNKLYVTRQVFFSPKNRKSIDLLLSVNGLPVATIELKNHFTGQKVKDAMEQYNTSRDPKELLFQFKKRALVHFSVDSDEVFFTTKLETGNTRFFPFNKGFNCGAGNPPAKNYTTYRTAYFWEEVLAADSWMDILGKYIHLQKEDYVVDGKTYYKEKMLFPRYHQLDVVSKLITDAKVYGAGKRYLVEHSAGSGKSNSIAWLAYRLSSLYNDNNEKVFNSVIVITDRTVLDQQLQNTIYQFEHKSGVVQCIEENAEQLAAAINSETKIIITTLQKFPYAISHLKDIPGKYYAVIIDEAHSSQGGESSRKMIEALSGKNASVDDSIKIESDIENESEDTDDFIRTVIEKRGPQSHISFFAFTATPKRKTLEVFGLKNEKGEPIPFHLYSMRQAIEEDFILDVLKNYTTYESYYHFGKKIEDDPELNKNKAIKAISRFASLHPTSVSQKTAIIIEHFRQITMKKIGGRAKAMVVTASRKHALKYYLAFKEYIKEKGYSNIKPLVAFSGSVIDDSYPEGITEAALNKFSEKELPGKFSTPEYQILLVADKYQYGFDQPLLHTMYVDKKLSGVRAVQTLSRINRTCPGKEDTFVLDFANVRQTIIDSFQPYYEMTTMSALSDPNHLYDLMLRTNAAQVYYQSEIDAFAKVFYKPGNASVRDQGKLYAYLDPAVDRYSALNEEKQDDFKNSLTTFIRLYSFLSQIMPFVDVSLEKLYSFGRFLLTRLPKVDYTNRLKLDNEVALEYYRLQKIAEGDLVLQIQGKYTLDPVTEAGISRPKDEKDRLSNIINLLNEKYDFDFTEQDQLYFDQIEQALFEDENLKIRAKNNPLENFKYAFDEVFIQALIDRMDANQEIFDKIMVDSEFKKDIQDWLTKKIYTRFKGS